MNSRCLLLGLAALGCAAAQDSPPALRQLAHDYYAWRAREFPVSASDQGLHTADDKLTDYSSAAIAARRRHVHELLQRVRAMKTDGWAKDDRIDRILFQAQLEAPDF